MKTKVIVERTMLVRQVERYQLTGADAVRYLALMDADEFGKADELLTSDKAVEEVLYEGLDDDELDHNIIFSAEEA